MNLLAKQEIEDALIERDLINNYGLSWESIQETKIRTIKLWKMVDQLQEEKMEKQWHPQQ